MCPKQTLTTGDQHEDEDHDDVTQGQGRAGRRGRVKVGATS